MLTVTKTNSFSSLFMTVNNKGLILTKGFGWNFFLKYYTDWFKVNKLVKLRLLSLSKKCLRLTFSSSKYVMNS